MLTAEAADEPNAEPTLAAATEVQRLDVAAMHEKALGILATLKASTVALAKKNVLSFFVDVVYTNPSNKQQMKGNCMCCSKPVTSTGSNRFVEHLCKCPMCPRVVRDEFVKLCEKVEGKRAEKRDAALMAAEEEQLAKQEHEQRQVVLKQQCIKAGIKGPTLCI